MFLVNNVWVTKNIKYVYSQYFAMNQEFSQPPLCEFDNLLKWLTDLRKTPFLLLQFIIKDTQAWEQPNGRDA